MTCLFFLALKSHCAVADKITPSTCIVHPNFSLSCQNSLPTASQENTSTSKQGRLKENWVHQISILKHSWEALNITSPFNIVLFFDMEANWISAVIAHHLCPSSLVSFVALFCSARLPPIRVEESSFSQDMQWLLERGVQFADVAFYAGDSGKELGWAHAAVLCAVSPYFRQLLLGPKTR